MIFARLLDQVERHPEALAVVDGYRRLDYAELAGRSAAVARLLAARYGLQPGAVVAISLPNCWQYPVCVFALASLGAVAMPFHHGWRGNEVAWMVDRLGIRLALTCADLSQAWQGSPAQIVDAYCLVDEAGATDGAIWPAPDADQPALYLTTSGSTGRPKIVPRSHGNLLAGSAGVAAALGLRHQDRFLSVVPFYHANGFANGMFLPLTQGGVAVMVRKALPTVLAETVVRENVGIVNMSPILYGLLTDSSGALEAFATTRICLSSGAPLPADVKATWQQRCGRAIRQLYGSSETGVIAIQGEEDDVPGSVGPPLPAVEVRVLDQDSRLVGSDVAGEILIRGPAMMNGYVGEPELNAGSLVDGFFRMGDIGRLSKGGELILEGRSKRWINAGGIKVDPVEVERVIACLPSVSQCRVVPGQSPRGLETVGAIVTLREPGAISRQQIIEHCRLLLAEYKIPRVIEFVEEMPDAMTGKTSMRWLPT